MPKFAVYKYTLSKSDNKNLFTQDGMPLDSQAREEFGKLLTARSLNIHKATTSGMPEIYRTENVCHDEVAAFTLENNRTVGQWMNKQKKSLPSYPYCWVVIDNRPGQMKMFIEDNSAWTSTDCVRDLLQANFNGKLMEVGLEITIRAEMQESEFWKVVDQRCRLNNDSVKKVVFELVNPEKAAGISLPNRQYAFLKTTLGVMEATNTYKSTFAMEANRRDAILLERTRRDLSQMVRLCCNNGYTIKVYFRKSKSYVAGDGERTYLSVKEGYLTLFANNSPTIAIESGTTYDLILCLNEASGNIKKKRHDRTT